MNITFLNRNKIIIKTKRSTANKMITYHISYTLKTLKNFMVAFYEWGSTASRLVPLWGGNLLFTTKFPDIPGTHFTDLGEWKAESTLKPPRSTQPFILPRLVKWVPGISGNVVVKSKLPPRSGTSLETVEPHP